MEAAGSVEALLDDDGAGPVRCVAPADVPDAVRSLTAPSPEAPPGRGPVERRRRTWVDVATPLIQQAPVLRGAHR